MKSRLNKKYAQVKSMEELRYERAKLHVYIDMMEDELRQDYDDVKSMFSLSYIMNKAITSISARTSIVDRISVGYGIFSDLLKSRKRKKQAHQREICQ